MASLTGEMQRTPARKVLLPKELKSLSETSLSSGGFHGQGTPALYVLTLLAEQVARSMMTKFMPT